MLKNVHFSSISALNTEAITVSSQTVHVVQNYLAAIIELVHNIAVSLWA